jgi:uncharacterized integral membrane protein
MQTLKLIILVALLLLVGFLAALNWEPVQIALPGQSLPYTAPLGGLLMGAFLCGLLPAMLWYKLSRWTLRRKLSKTEAKLQAAHAPAAAAPTTDPEAALLARARAAGGASGYGGDLPAQARPITVPPGGA